MPGTTRCSRKGNAPLVCYGGELRTPQGVHFGDAATWVRQRQLPRCGRRAPSPQTWPMFHGGAPSRKAALSAARGCRGMIRARQFLGTVVVRSEPVVVRDGVRLVCRDRGGPGGEPVVLLHGLAGHAGEWEVVASRLIPRYRVVAVAQREHGASERHPQHVSQADYVADIVAAVEQLGLRRPVLVGQSLGGHSPAHRRHPSRARPRAGARQGRRGRREPGHRRGHRWLAQQLADTGPLTRGSSVLRRLGGRRRVGGWPGEREDGW
ncbi:alpha/beta fold hydrolase [Streptomyces bobili]|uniref:alpha/beta fold hydrolase n=1 Tax=Streptomyces bobili TaxID=67280 RepID=UPI0037149A39